MESLNSVSLETEESLAEGLKALGLRPTQQRMMLGKVIWGKGNRHLTAESVQKECKMRGFKVSLATIYNTLHQFTSVGILKEIAVEGERSYFDTRMEPHYHFLNEATGELIDIPPELGMDVVNIPEAPHGMRVMGVDVVVRIQSIS